jgi:cytidyltransferase-like protein
MIIEQLKKILLAVIKSNGLNQKDFEKLNKENQQFLEKKANKYFLKPEYRKLFRVVLTGGVFDILHPGHIYTLEQAKKYGDILVVVIATDETVKKTKKRSPLHNQKTRLKLVSSLSIVDLAIPGKKNWKHVLKQVSPDVVVFGYDQEPKKIDGVKIIKLKKFLNFKNSKTGKIRKMLGI